jgi:addiction module HigA family antidote
MAPRTKNPTTPGEILNKEFLKPLRLAQKQLANHIGCDIKVVNRIVNDRAAITAEMALKLAAAFETSAEFWMNAQKAVDLFKASQKVKKIPRQLRKPPNGQSSR